jgi:sigma-B regulation protein RsbU (phosphoserine phosphatase)
MSDEASAVRRGELHPTQRSEEAQWSQIRHDLRTPLNQILGYGEMLEEDAQAAGQESAVSDLRKIQQAARRMLELINQHLGAQSIKPAALPPAGDGSATQGAVPAAGATAGNGSASASLSEPDEPADREPLRGRVLVVDDSAPNREVLSRRLERRGLTIRQAEDGDVALATLASEPFDLVLLDVLMPRRDGYETLLAMKQDETLRNIPVIMISALDELDTVIRCIEAGAEDYLPKPFNPTLLRARINACLEKKRLRDTERQHLAEIERTQKRLSRELHDAEAYLRSLFPEPLRAPVAVDWFHQSCSELGGDALGYHWLDDDHLALYLLDVCGHGVGSSLLSAAAINIIRTGSLPGTELRNPAEVLGALNRMFPMERQNGLYFTIWYGVWQVSTRTLHYSAAGHPPPVLAAATDSGVTTQGLDASGLMIGAFDDAEYDTHVITIPGPAQLFIVTDGCFEIRKTDGTMMAEQELQDFLAKSWRDSTVLTDWFQHCQTALGHSSLDDDFTMVRVHF